MKKKTIIWVSVVFVLLVLLFFWYSFSGVCADAIRPNHLRTNILTGQCDFGGYDSCYRGDPFPWKRGCDDLTKEGKILLIKDSDDIERTLEFCAESCGEEISLNCTSTLLEDEEILCVDLL